LIRLGSPSISTADIDRVAKVMMSGFLVQGPEVLAFERELAELLDVRHVVVMSNCTSALEVALRALSIGHGDIVITSSYSWVATANVIEVVGATPVFVDISPASYNIDIDALREIVSGLDRAGDLGRLKAIMPVHAFGLAADMVAIQAIAHDLGVPVVEDAACALGARSPEGAIGTMGAAGCFSFHPRKSITTGEGGALATNDDSIAHFAFAYRNHGQTPGLIHEFDQIGHNYRLTDAMAALGRSQLLQLPAFLTRRRQIMTTYLEQLQGYVELPEFHPDRHAGQAFVVRLPADCDRSQVMKIMKENGVETGTGTVAIPFTDVYLSKYGFTHEEFPHLASIMDRTLALPIHADMSSDDAEFVARTLIEALSQASGPA
jgi:perosamine synthetase